MNDERKHEDRRSPAFQFYPKDFLSDENVRMMSLQERGAYITLLSLCWIEGSLPAELERLARLCGSPLTAFRRFWRALEPCFRPDTRNPDRLIHPRLEREREKQQEYQRRQSDRGKAGAESRWHKHGASMAQASSGHSNPAMPSDSSSSASAFAIASSQEKHRAREGHRRHVFCGKTYCVSASQHDLLFRNLGSARDDFDLLAAYSRWDALNEPIDNLLPWLKAKISNELRLASPQVSKLTTALAKAGADFLSSE